jgi:hypothetical protein
LTEGTAAISKLYDGTITIGNFPDAAIFDPVLVANNRGEFYKYISIVSHTIVEFGIDGKRRFGNYDEVYTELKVCSETVASIAEPLMDEDEIDSAAAYVAAGNMLLDLYVKLEVLVVDLDALYLSDMVTDIMYESGTLKKIEETINTATYYPAWQAVGNALEESIFYKNNGDAWESFLSAVTPPVDAYRNALETIEQETESEGIKTAIVSAENVRIAFETGDLFNYPVFKEFDDIMAKVYAAITATTGVSMGSIGIGLDGAPPVTLGYMAGWFLFEEDDDKLKVQNNTLNFIIGQDIDQYGFTKLYFDFAFKAFGSRSAFTWHINGGLDNYLIDDGKGMGGAILLKVGTPPLP